MSRGVFTETNRWYHVAVSMDSANEVSFYVDRKLVDQLTADESMRDGSDSANLGSKSGSNERLRGLMSDVAIYDCVLGPEQIAMHSAMGRLQAGKIPLAVNDQYSIAQASTLTATVAQSETPRHTFRDDFSSGQLNPNLEDPSTAFVIRDGELSATEKRRYLRTVRSDYANGDFLFEVDVDLTTLEQAIEFPGIGSGRRGQVDEPADAVFLRIHSMAYDGQVSFNSSGPGGAGNQTIGTISKRGTHRVRFVKTGNQLTVEIDANFDGFFVPDISYTVDDFNRDQIVSATDVVIARDHQVGPLVALPIISPPNHLPGPPAAVRALDRPPIERRIVPGDSNRDGKFDSQDLVLIFQAGLFEDDVANNAGWVEGDWNDDGEFDSADLIQALQFGDYES